MSQEQEMRSEEIQRDGPKPTFVEDVPGYRSYASETAGQKIQEVSAFRFPSLNQRLFLAVVSLGMLMFVSLAAMFLFAHMGAGAPAAYGPGFDGPGPVVNVYTHDGTWMYQLHEHGRHMGHHFHGAIGAVSQSLSWLLLVPLFLFFVATIAVNVLFSRDAK